MRKRTAVFISSSDDDDVTQSSHLSCRNVNSKCKSSTPSLKRSKKVRFEDSSSFGCNEFRAIDEFDFCEDFREGFSGLDVSAVGRSEGKELWVDKYKPRSIEELAVHKRKVEEVKLWFEERLRFSKKDYKTRVLILSGQAGVGKSATVQVIATTLGARLCEWRTPTPTIWQEHIHNNNSGLLYASKLDEFENFIEITRKYGMLSGDYIGDMRSPVILLIDDLPMTNGSAAFHRLRDCLHLLVHTTPVPTILSVSDYGTSKSDDKSVRNLEELQLSLESAGACKISFNPITVNSIKKIISRICKEEKCRVCPEEIDQIANASGGDIRNAITNLQFFYKNHGSKLSIIPNGNPRNRRGKSDDDDDDGGCGSFSSLFGKDETITLFHAMGKFLHNKRVASETTASDDTPVLRERFRRLPLKMDVPENIISSSHLQAGSVADFLHENALDFLGDEAVDDAWVINSYLGDADVFLSRPLSGKVAGHEAENLINNIAASVAARGVLFGNSHPLPPKWHAVRGPRLWKVGQSLARNKVDLRREAMLESGVLGCTRPSVVATDFRPVCTRWLGPREAPPHSADCIGVGSRREGGDDDDGIESDGIEEW